MVLPAVTAGRSLLLCSVKAGIWAAGTAGLSAGHH